MWKYYPWIFNIFLITMVSALKTYENYKVFQTTLSNNEQIQYLKRLAQENQDYKFWAEPNLQNPTAHLMVAPRKIEEFASKMNLSGITYQTYIENVQSLIDRINPSTSSYRKPTKFCWTRYHPLEEIYSWLEHLAKKYRQVKVVVAGKTYEGRPIKGVKLSFGKREKPGVLIEAGIHANEWIGPATATYLLNAFLTSKNPKIRKLARSYDWYIFPVFNPDGYVYTFTEDRLWRKNRVSSGNGCFGVDPNRNWDYKWMSGGASDDPCNDKYAGSKPFSEIETKTLSDYILSISDKLFAFISFHSYGQLLLLPYGYTIEHLDNYDELFLIGNKTINSLEKLYSTKYKIGNIPEVLWIDSGSSIDWVKGKLKLPIAYTYELRDSGKYAFLLPEEQIIPNCKEVLYSFLTLFKEAAKMGYPKYKFWREPNAKPETAHLMVAPENLHVYIENVQSLIDSANPPTLNSTDTKNFSWTRYHRLEEINSWLEDLDESYSEVSVFAAGKSYEGREIKGVKLSFGDREKPGVFIEAGIHAREWISPATATYLLNEFLTSKDPKVRQLATNYDWYIIPVFNPDGYVYSFAKDRLWRKSRVPSGNGCFGVDLNRNWDYKWMGNGASNDPCNDNYAGTKPFSEMETKTISEYIMSISDKLFAFISLHSHGQYLLLPYGYSTEHLDNYDELFFIGKKAMHSLQHIYGTTYTIGNPPEIFKNASGITMDWVKGQLKLPIVYSYEMRDKGKYGYVLPAEQIIPNGKEILNSFVTLFEEASKMGYPNETPFIKNL